MHNFRQSSLAITALATLVISGKALAQNTALEQVEDVIIVTGTYLANEKFSATKTVTPLIDVPQSLSVTSQQQIADQAFRSLEDVVAYTPAVSIGQGEGHRDQVTVRGQNTTADFFIDGLRDDAQYFRPLYNLSQVEVLRGSNALIFGRGGGGGVINRVTKTPTLGENFGAASVSLDSFGASYVSADANLALGDGSAFRLNAFYEHLNNHRDGFDGNRFAINPTVLTELGADTSLLLSYEYINDDRVVDRGVPSLNGEPLRGFDEFFFGDPDFNRSPLEAHIARARFDHRFSDGLSFNATAQYANYDKSYQNLFPVGFDDVAGTVSFDGYIDIRPRENLIVQANFIADFNTGSIGHTLLVGAEYGDQNADNSRRDTVFTSSNDDQVTFLFSNPLVIPQVTFPVLNRERDSDVEFVSFYLQDQIDLTESLKIIAGLRYDRFDIEVVDFVEVNNGTADGNDGFLARVDEEISPRIGLIYKPQQNISLYASFSRSFLPRSGDQFLTLTLNTQALAPEQFNNFEIGAKWDIRRDLSLTGALFRLDREGGTTVDPSDVGNTIIIGSRTQGFEVQLSGQLMPKWNINAGYSYLDADERGRVVGGALANRTLSQVPEHMISVWNRYDVNEHFGLGLGVIFQSAQFASISNAVELPDFARVDAAVYYDVSERLQIQLNVQNLFDANFFPAAHNDNNISTAAPLNARFTISGKF